MLDTRRSIETPEGVELGLRVAGPLVRAYAWSIDFLVQAVIYIALYFMFAIVALTKAKFFLGILLIVYFCVYWLYPVIFEIYNRGATPGKRALGIKVVHDDGTEVNLQSSLTRNLLRVVDMLPVMYMVGIIASLFNSSFKRLGDMTAGTIVVYTDKLVQGSEIKSASPLTPPIPLTSDEQKAVIQFAERFEQFTPQRASELANILEPVTHSTNEKGVEKILQYANWMMGRR